MGDLDWVQIALMYGVLLVSLVLHEASHALFAYWGGDRTAYHGGQMTVNPIPHMQREPFGTIVIPLVLLLMSNGNMIAGFAHVPVDARWASRHPKKAALMSAAGPLANICLVLVAVLVLKTLVWTELARPGSRDFVLWVITDEDVGPVYAIARIASCFAFINIVLAILNLIPLPPFDGAGIVGGLFRETRRLYDTLRSQPIFMIIGLILAWRILHYTVWPVASWAFRLI